MGLKKGPWERVQAIMDYYGMTKNSFSLAIGLANNATIGRIIAEQRKPNSATMFKILTAFPAISRTWLLTGVGEMFDKENEQKGTNIVYANTGGNLGHSADENNILQNLVKQKDEIIKSLQALVEQQQKIITKLSK